MVTMFLGGLIMPNIYYLFSNSRELEAMCFCEDSAGIERPKYRTGVHPMGSILSTTVKVLTPWIQSDFSYDLEEKLSEGFQSIPPSSSFTALTNNDKILDRLLYMLIIKREEEHSGKYFQKLVQTIKTYINYIDLCQNNRELSTVDKLIYLCSQNKNTLPQYSIYTGSVGQSECFSQNEIKTILANSKKSDKRYTPELQKGNRHLFKLPPIPNGEHQWGELTTPIRVFEIYNIIDLILSSLQCIFEKKHVINKCAYCNNLFVSNRKLKYCPPMLIEDKDCCRVQSKREKEQHTISRKRYHSIHTMLYERIGRVTGDERAIRDKEFQDFIQKARAIREKGTMSENDYIIWMNQYWENVKEEAKKRKKAKSSK